MKTELKITDLLAWNADKRFTMNGIATAIGGRYSLVHRTVTRLAGEGVIIREKAGKAYLCSLNFGNEKAAALVQLGEIEKRDEFYGKNGEMRLILEDFVKSIGKRPGLFAVVLFGSRSKGTATTESDIDVLVLGRSGTDMGKTTREIHAKYGKELNPITMTPDEFKEQKDKALIREIMHDHHILYGAENFVRLVFGK